MSLLPLSSLSNLAQVLVVTAFTLPGESQQFEFFCPGVEEEGKEECSGWDWGGGEWLFLAIVGGFLLDCFLVHVGLSYKALEAEAQADKW